MHTNEETLSLANLKGGAVIEAFDEALTRVLRNIRDPNTKPTATREVTLKVKIKPDEDRYLNMVAVDITPKLAPDKSIFTQFIVEGRGGHVEAHELIQNQQSMFEGGKVASLDEKREEGT